jgi:hypothetical protein
MSRLEPRRGGIIAPGDSVKKKALAHFPGKDFIVLLIWPETPLFPAVAPSIALSNPVESCQCLIVRKMNRAEHEKNL